MKILQPNEVMSYVEAFGRYCQICEVPDDVKERVLLVWQKRAIQNDHTKYHTHLEGYVVHRAGRQFAEYQQALEYGKKHGAWTSENFRNDGLTVDIKLDSAKEQAILHTLRTDIAIGASSHIDKGAREGTSLKNFMEFFALSLKKQFQTLDYTEFLETFLKRYSNFFDEQRRQQDKKHARLVMEEKTDIVPETGFDVGEFLLRF